MAKKVNELANKLTNIAMRQMQVSWNFKLPRVRTIRKYRMLYNSQTLPRLRSQFNVPLPVFPGMIDTLQADFNDKLLLKFEATDPADWKAAQKVNAAVKQTADSQRPGAQWDDKDRSTRFEMIITGRGINKFTAGDDGGFHSELEVVPFEDFYFEPTGGGTLEDHLYCGQQNVWRTKAQLQTGAAEGIYDREQVRLLTREGGREWKMAGIWDGDFDFGNRFKPLGLDATTNNYTGEDVFNLIEWVLTYEGKRWYILFDAYTGIWVRFIKLEEIASSGYYPWMSCASHKDLKNFASKSFADDLYPVADSINTLFNQELTNRQKRNLNAKAYDAQMFTDVAKLDEAQYRPDALVPVDTKNGARKIADGLYAFQTPEITGTVNMIEWLTANVGKDLGVTALQQGQLPAGKQQVGVISMQLAQVAKRLAFSSAPFTEMGLQRGLHFFGALKDYMKQPLAVKLFGEDGVEWDLLKRIELSTKKDFEITVSSQTQESSANEKAKSDKVDAAKLITADPNMAAKVNPKVMAEFIARDVGHFSEFDISLLLDVTADTDRETMAEVSAAIQDIVLRSKKPPLNWNADRFFIRRFMDFAIKHKDTLKAKQFDLLMEYANDHFDVALQNTLRQAEMDAKLSMQPPGAPGAAPGQGGGTPGNPKLAPQVPPGPPGRFPIAPAGRIPTAPTLQIPRQ